MSGSDLFDLSRRVALVTGGNGGIGLGMAKGLGEAGASGRSPVGITIIKRPESRAASMNSFQLGVLVLGTSASANFARRAPRHHRTFRSTNAAAMPALSKMDLRRPSIGDKS